MQIDPFWLIAAAAGGFFGAAIGALQSFIFCGVTVLLGVVGMFGNASASFIGYVAFGPVFGPHIAFAGGVAAVAYASRRGYANGKDIVTPLITLGKTDVLLVGAGFGVLGYLLHAGIAAIPWFGGHTDAVAVTVIVSGLIARFAFGQSGLTGVLPSSRRSSARTVDALQPVSGQPRYAPTEPGQAERLEDLPPRATGWSRFAPSETGNWVRHQESFAAHSAARTFCRRPVRRNRADDRAGLSVGCRRCGDCGFRHFGGVVALPVPRNVGPGDASHDADRRPGRGLVPARRRRQRAGGAADRRCLRDGGRVAGRVLRTVLAQSRRHPHRPAGLGNLVDDDPGSRLVAVLS